MANSNPENGFNDGRRAWQPRPLTPAPAAKNRGASNTDKRKKTFADVAGCDEAVAKLRRIRKWLKKPTWFNGFGAKLPKGVLLFGPPGTGKTLLAQVLADEADANFFPVSGSQFVEEFVGVGASRIRDLFDEAMNARTRTGKPSIIFIDEIDAIGKTRSTRNVSGEGERDQTLTQLLNCVGGFNPSSGIMVLAATNIPETLDEALMRPGRFDYHILVGHPDIDGREKIFAVHTRLMELAPDVNLRDLAMRTTDFSGATIEAVCNEAAINAAERQEYLTVGLSDEQLKALPHVISPLDFDRAIDYLLFGDEYLARTHSQLEEEAWKTSIHEAGHAVIATVTRGDPVDKLTRVLHSKFVGMMQSHPAAERYSFTDTELRGQIMTSLAGQAAQFECLGLRDTRPISDLAQASRMARFMVGVYGMSRLGPIQINLDQNGFPAARLSSSLAKDFDRAWTSIVSECWTETLELVRAHRGKIERIAKALLREETILAERFRELYESEEN
jgi:cell division protease FtsH